jgi:hypothetical protein
MEDCKMYGGIDDAVRIQSGNFEVMRSVFEKMGSTGGDNVNIKSGSVGDFAYNLCIGNATNSSKASDKGGTAPVCNVCMYNNTYINGGWRNTSSGVGSDIDYEQGATGAAYNNLIVNCRIGFRVVASPVADTIMPGGLQYGDNWIYGDNGTVTSQFYPNPGGITEPWAYLPPIPSETGYVYVGSGSLPYNPADTAALNGANKPLFVNFPLPETYPLLQVNNGEPTLVGPQYAGPGFNFRLTSASPCIGKGTASFPSGYPLNACASVSIPKLGFSPQESPPCTDLGCYPYTNTSIGNQQ